MKTRIAFASVLAVAVPLAGCSFDLGSSTKGEEGHADFSYSSWNGCFFGCDTSRPMMRGTQEFIHVTGGDLTADLTFGTDNPAVISVSNVSPNACCDTDDESSCGDPSTISGCAGKLTFSYSVAVDAVGDGSASLLVRTPDGKTFDSLPLQVVAPARLDFHCPLPDNDDDPALTQLDLPNTCEFQIDAFSASGDPLQASSGFDITSADPTLVEVRPDFFLDFGGPTPAVHDANGSLRSLGKGSTTLTIKAGAATTAVALTTH